MGTQQRIRRPGRVPERIRPSSLPLEPEPVVLEGRRGDAIQQALASFDFVLARVIDLYLAGQENSMYHTDPVRRAQKMVGCKARLEHLREEWGAGIRNSLELYGRALEILKGRNEGSQ